MSLDEVFWRAKYSGNSIGHLMKSSGEQIFWKLNTSLDEVFWRAKYSGNSICQSVTL